MWDTVVEISTHLTHDLPCPRCGHGGHRYLPCDHCACEGANATTYDSRFRDASLSSSHARI
jgi:hypothetical protein